MAILTQNIKLLKSAVMADTTDGGGQMTGTEVIDGQSNNLFPDTSAMDRAFGRVNMRKVFGVAHTSDTDTLLGAHAIMTDAPDDPLVHCTLLKTTGWADERDTAREAIEKYLVKGPKAAPRIYDTHYAGSLQLRLISFVGATFPTAGDAVVLTNPNGVEQYVRILKITTTNQLVAMVENSSTVVNSATVATCDLGSALSMDVLGPPGVRVFGANGVSSEGSYATVHTTNIAGGAKFYGVKPLGQPALVGDLSAITAGGIYTNLVPAATVESPIIDQFPLLGRAAISATASVSVSLPALASVAIGPNSLIYFPTAIEPKSLSIVHGATTFTDNGGVLYQGTTEVADVDYFTGQVAFRSNAGNYGTATLTPSYKPGSVVGASSHSAELLVTIANQGLAFTDIFSPKPAVGSFTLSFMAQGRWYDLDDNLSGKLVGADSGYGVGTLNYTTGSMAVTLGAVPDVGSSLIASWGDTESGKAVATTLPTRAGLVLPVAVGTKVEGNTATWSRGVTNYSAVTNAAGLFTGDASGYIKNGEVVLMPAVFPDGNVTFTTKLVATSQTSFTNGGGGSYTLTGTLPIIPGTFSANVIATLPSNVVWQDVSQVYSIYDANGILYVSGAPVGTINYSSGAVTVNSSVTKSMSYLSSSPAPGGGAFVSSAGTIWYIGTGNLSVSIGSPITNVSYYAGSVADVVTVVTPSAWRVQVDTQYADLITKGLAFTLGGSLYTSKGTALESGWNAATGIASIANAGNASSTGDITVTSVPSNGVNTVAWVNVASNSSAKQVDGGIFRTDSAPLKTGVFQLQAGLVSGSANDAGVISGGFSGTVDYTRGIARWSGPTIDPAALSYNAVYLQYLPLDASLLGLETARLPLDGKVPIYRTGDLVVVHNTLSTALANPLVKDFAYTLGRERIASVRVKDALGVVVPDTLYTTDLNGGFLTVPTASNITAYTQPLTVEHRIEDMVLCSKADISGTLSFTRSLTHNFPAATSFVSSAMPFGDLFARAYNLMEQSTWTSVWSNTLIGSTIIPQFNSALYPIVVTNAGAIKERWVIIFTNTTGFRIIGESVGEIGSGNTSTNAAPLNPATGVPYFTIPATGWGAGWATGNVLRFNTDACGTPFWAVRTVLQGPTSIDSDQFTLAFRGDVDRP